MSGAPVIEVSDVTKAFGGVTAVDGVSLSIADNAFVALLGASGCGKTTLLRLIAGLERADAGRVAIAGADMTRTPAHLRPVNLMFQSYALFPHMSVADNVAFGLKQDGLRGDALTSRVAEALAMVEMAGLGERKPEQLSGGQQQRVALARCLAKRPKALLLDEPMAALDRSLRERTRLELMNLRRRLGIAFVVVTHDQEDAMTMADTVAVMDRGRVVQTASPRDLYERPNTRLVAGFFGENNLFEGRVGLDGRSVACDGLRADIAVADALPPPGTQVTLAVRPERITAAAGGVVADTVIAGASVEDVVYLGTVSTYLARVPGGAVVRITRQNGAVDTLTRGARISLGWPAGAAVVLTS